MSVKQARKYIERADAVVNDAEAWVEVGTAVPQTLALLAIAHLLLAQWYGDPS